MKTEAEFPVGTLRARLRAAAEAGFSCVEVRPRHQILYVAALIVFSLALRLCSGIALPHPLPYCSDEYSYLLAADTFASGRLANPPHPLWRFFESPQVLAHPIHASKYPPAQGAFLAFGQVVFGDPAAGVWLSVGLMAGAICWALLAYVPPGWALLAGIHSAITLGPGHYWTESYWGGAVAAVGGALVVGSYIHLTVRRSPVHGWILGLGVLLLCNSRPWEGGVLVLCVGGLFVVESARHRDNRLRLLTPVAASALVIAGLMGYYNWSVTGNALQMPYSLYQAQYGPAPTLWILPAKLSPAYGHPELRLLFESYLKEWVGLQDVPLPSKFAWSAFRFVLMLARTATPMVLAALIFVPFLWRHRMVRTLGTVCLIAGLALLLNVSMYLHYAAPLLSLIVILDFMVLYHLFSDRGGYDGAGRWTAGILLCLIFGGSLHRAAANWDGQDVNIPGPRWQTVARRSTVTSQLLKQPGAHVVFVRYGSRLQSPEEWVFNGAQIDSANPIWAYDLGDEKNLELMNYFKGRRFWLIRPYESLDVTPYSGAPGPATSRSDGSAVLR